jgi:cell division protein FtsZ
MGILTVAVVTRPFVFEGKRRQLQAERGMAELLESVDTLIVIPNEKLLAYAKDLAFFDCCRIADDVLRQAVQGISDIITVTGFINRDFADVRTTMAGMGHAVMGTASCTGENRAIEAAKAAITSPLIESAAIDGARGLLVNITGSSNMKASEVSAAMGLIQDCVHEDANILFGAVKDDRMGDAIKITVIATGFGEVVTRRRTRMLNEDPIPVTAVPIVHPESWTQPESEEPNAPRFLSDELRAAHGESSHDQPRQSGEELPYLIASARGEEESVYRQPQPVVPMQPHYEPPASIYHQQNYQPPQLFDQPPTPAPNQIPKQAEQAATARYPVSYAPQISEAPEPEQAYPPQDYLQPEPLTPPDPVQEAQQPYPLPTRPRFAEMAEDPALTRTPVDYAPGMRPVRNFAQPNDLFDNPAEISDDELDTPAYIQRQRQS